MFIHHGFVLGTKICDLVVIFAENEAKDSSSSDEGSDEESMRVSRKKGSIYSDDSDSDEGMCFC